MKIFSTVLLTSMLLISALPCRAAFEPPTEGQLDQLLANPALINITIKGANGQEAAGVIIRVIDRLVKAQLNKSQLNYLVALYSSKTLLLLPAGEAKAFASELVAKAPQDLIPTIIAALSIGSSGIADFSSYLEELAGDDAALSAVIKNPSAHLTPPVHNLLLTTLGTTQALPPAVVDSLPPPIPVGEPEPPPPPPPPVSEGYAGQTGG